MASRAVPARRLLVVSAAVGGLSKSVILRSCVLGKGVWKLRCSFVELNSYCSRLD